MEPKDMRDLNIALRNSFEGIKRDMSKLRETVSTIQNSQAMSDNELKKDIAEVKETAVKVDKLNLFKIKLSEMGDNVRQLYDMNNEFKELAKTVVTKKDVTKIRDELTLHFTGFANETNARVENLRKEIRLTKQKEETLLSKEEFGGFTSTLNHELDYLRKTIEKTYDIKDTITKRELDKKTDDLKKEIEDLKKVLKDAEKKYEEYTKVASQNKDDIEKVSLAVSANFNTVKNKVAEKVSESQVRTLLNDINTEFDKTKNEISKLRGALDEMKELKKTVHEIKKTAAYEEEVEVLAEQLESLKDQVVTGRDVARMLKEIKSSEKTQKMDRVEKVVKLEKSAKFEARKTTGTKDFKKTLFFANTFIFLSFASLIGAIIAFFAKSPAYMDNLSIAAVIWFLIGIVLRVFVILRRG